jgi:hypothetical protein
MAPKAKKQSITPGNLSETLSTFSYSDLHAAGKIIEETIRNREKEAAKSFPHNTVVEFMDPSTGQTLTGYIKWRNERTSNIIDINGQWHKINWCHLKLAVNQ